MAGERDELTLLHLSDLHIKNNFPEQEKCRKRFLQFLEEYSQQGLIDYVAITGDVMHHSDNNNYAPAQDFIGRLLESLELKEDALFVVPGNHDKDISDLLSRGKKGEKKEEKIKRLEQERKKREKERTNVKNILNGESEGNEFLSRFSTYLRFAARYNTGMKVPAFFEGADGKPVGVCVRQKHKVCFVLLNTEWLYVDPADQTNMMIGNRLVKEIEERVNKYEGYRVITLIHRSFRQLAWEEVYSKEERKSSMDLIIDFSNLILAGHGHTKSSGVPDFLQNRTQLLEGGAFGALPDGKNHIYKAQANLLKINFRQETLEILGLQYDYKDRKWKKGEIRRYWLKSYLYPLKKETEEMPENDPVEQYPVILVKEDEKEAIEKAILQRLYGQDHAPAGINIVVCSLFETGFGLKEDGRNHLIFYAFLYKKESKRRLARIFFHKRDALHLSEDQDVCSLIFLEQIS